MNANEEMRVPNTMDVTWSVGKLAICVFAIILLLNVEELVEIIDQSSSEVKTHSSNSGLSYDGSVESGKANFFLLYEPSDVEILVTSIHGDSDLYAVENKDLDYFFDRFPRISEIISKNAITSAEKVSSLVILQHSFPWEGFAMPSGPERESKRIKGEVEGTVYWSAVPPFSYSSATLGVEKIHIPSSKELPRPLLVYVFASPTGLNSDHFNYTLKMRSEKLHTSSYSTVRWSAERGTLSYEQHVRRFSTIPSEMDDSDWMTMEGETELKGAISESTPGSVMQLVEFMRPLLLGLLETIAKIIL